MDNYNEIINMEDQKKLAGWKEDIVLKQHAENMKVTSNAVEFKKELERIGGCNRYLPCELCYKCLNKASHLYQKCQTCRIPICVHTEADRKLMLRKENFKIETSKEVNNILEELSNEFKEK